MLDATMRLITTAPHDEFSTVHALLHQATTRRRSNRRSGGRDALCVDALGR
jgi:hypothetical protein